MSTALWEKGQNRLFNLDSESKGSLLVGKISSFKKNLYCVF